MMRIDINRHTVRSSIIALVAGAFVLLAITPPASAQQPPPGPTLAINQVNGDAYPTVAAIVTVLDEQGVPVAGLTAADFQAFDGQTPLTVARAAAAQDTTLALGVVVTIDVSGSMAAALPGAQAAATTFVRGLGPNDQAAIVSFSDTVITVTPFTSDKQVLTDAIAGLVADGGTALYQAVQTSAFIATAAPTPRKAIVLLSDGENDTASSNVTADQALATAGSAGIPFFPIGFGDAPDEAFLQSLADQSQGQYLPATSSDVTAVYNTIANLLRSQYALELQSPNAGDGQQGNLTIIATVAGTAAQASAPFARGVAPPPVPTTAPQPTPQAQPEPESGSSTNIAAILVGVVVGIAILAAVLFVLRRWLRGRRELRAQNAIVAPNPRLAAAQGVPRAVGQTLGPTEAAKGRLLRVGTSDGAAAPIDITTTPVRIGSDPGATVALPQAADVAPQHAHVWIRGDRIMLRHVGGPSRSTRINGRPIDWVTLEDGDEFTVGPHRFRAERV